MAEETTLPRDVFSQRLRELTDNPGALKASSRVDLADFYGRSETWNVDTFRVNGRRIAFLQRGAADGFIRIVLPEEVMAALDRQGGSLTGRSRSRGARQAVDTKRAAGQRVGNPDALRKARRGKKR